MSNVILNKIPDISNKIPDISNKIPVILNKIPWVEKYRPKNSNEIILDPFIKQKIDKILETKSIPNMIITGEPGTGKTSTIICLAKELYTNNTASENILELNASDDRGLSIMNNIITPFCKKKTKDNIMKLVILDEADSITTKAQNLLSNIIAEYRKNTRFVFVCNDCSQITESIQSRCMIIKYGKISNEDLFTKIEYICKIEQIEYNEEAINTLLFLSDNDIRQSINNLECIHYSGKQFNKETIYSILNKPKHCYMNLILTSCLNNNINDAIKIVTELYNNGHTPNDILMTFMKCLMENELDTSLEHDKILKIYEIVSLCYVRVNSGIDTLLQLCGCIAKICLYIQN
jgi:replication factor C subunit 2/4